MCYSIYLKQRINFLHPVYPETNENKNKSSNHQTIKKM